MRIFSRFPAEFRFLFIIILWLGSCLAKYKFNGDVFGLDYNNLQPDGKHYAFRTLIFMGQTEAEAANQVIAWYEKFAPSNSGFALSDMAPATNAVWGLVAPRVLYSILSIPFVYFFGLQGMLVISAISLLIIYLSISHLAKKLNTENLGLFIIIFLSCSTTLYRWMFSNCTDALLAGLFALVAVQIHQVRDKNSAFKIVILILLTSLTRFCLPIWIAIALFLFFRVSKKFALSTMMLASLISIPTFLVMPNNTLIPSIQEASTGEKLLQLPISLAKVLFIEFAELAVLDRALLFILVATILMAIIHSRDDESFVFLLVLGSVFLIGAINGTLGVNFRYQLPVIPFMSLVILKNANLLNQLFRIQKP
jgi:hypothetical protein